MYRLVTLWPSLRRWTGEASLPEASSGAAFVEGSVAKSILGRRVEEISQAWEVSDKKRIRPSPSPVRD